MKQIIEDLNWRYATKKFDPDKKLTQEQVETLMEVLRLTPTSYGLQPLKFLLVENKAIREQLKIHSWNQSQVVDASHLFVLCAYTNVNDEHVNRYMKNTSEIRETEQSKLDAFSTFIKEKLAPKTNEELFIWTSKQAYISLGHFLHACAQMRIDATPMEGFEPEGYDQILNLSEKHLRAVLVVPVGYRHVEDKNQYQKKVRMKHEELFEIIR